MTALVVLSCDRTRNGQPCRGSRPTRQTTAGGARHEAAADGWRSSLVDLPGGAHEYRDSCPSGGHDEEPS